MQNFLIFGGLKEQKKETVYLVDELAFFISSEIYFSIPKVRHTLDFPVQRSLMRQESKCLS